MKKLLLFFLLLVSILTSCSNEYAKEGYNDNSFITQTGDHYSKYSSVFNGNQVNYGKLTAKAFDGIETLIHESNSVSKDVKLEISYKYSSGTGKLVFVNNDLEIDTLIENKNEFIGELTIHFIEKNNWIKFVGYDVKGLEIEIKVS